MYILETRVYLEKHGVYIHSYFYTSRASSRLILQEKLGGLRFVRCCACR